MREIGMGGADFADFDGMGWLVSEEVGNST